jgi:hypothetical protein
VTDEAVFDFPYGTAQLLSVDHYPANDHHASDEEDPATQPSDDMNCMEYFSSTPPRFGNMVQQKSSPDRHPKDKKSVPSEEKSRSKKAGRSTRGETSKKKGKSISNQEDSSEDDGRHFVEELVSSGWGGQKPLVDIYNPESTYLEELLDQDDPLDHETQDFGEEGFSPAWDLQTPLDATYNSEGEYVCRTTVKGNKGKDSKGSKTSHRKGQKTKQGGSSGKTRDMHLTRRETDIDIVERSDDESISAYHTSVDLDFGGPDISSLDMERGDSLDDALDLRDRYSEPESTPEAIEVSLFPMLIYSLIALDRLCFSLPQAWRTLEILVSGKSKEKYITALKDSGSDAPNLITKAAVKELGLSNNIQKLHKPLWIDYNGPVEVIGTIQLVGRWKSMDSETCFYVWKPKSLQRYHIILGAKWCYENNALTRTDQEVPSNYLLPISDSVHTISAAKPESKGMSILTKTELSAPAI